MYFFSSNLQRSPWRKKKRGPVAPLTGDRGLSPVGGATGPFFPGTYFELFVRVFVIIVGKISAANVAEPPKLLGPGALIFVAKQL